METPESNQPGKSKREPEMSAGRPPNETRTAALSEKEVFFEAIAIDDVHARNKFLNEKCGSDVALKKGVAHLLAAHDSKSELLIDRNLFRHPGIEEQRKSGMEIGTYTLEERLGEGGMGDVWLANQTSPVNRQVALKFVRSDRETPGLLHRFETERQSLATMDHPNIAKVLDADSTATGRPYFVMEFVQGQPLMDFCDEGQLSIRERLRIFVQISNAISHAHQKAIIHRDLKPSNILVSWIDGQPVAKVIDFGLAKALVDQPHADSIVSQVGTVIGTIEYMAPEQAGFENQDIDTRADIYSLGVILYELLTGLRPFAPEQLENKSLEQKLQVIRQDDPTLPSVRLAASNEVASIASYRKTDSSLLSGILKNELDWIVMKALDKDRQRRYQSAGEFSEDIQRFLNGEPILAHPPSKRYRVKKFVNKNRGLVFSIAAIATTLLLGIIGTSYGLYQSQKYASEAVLAKQKAIEQKEEAIKAKVAADLATQLEAQQKKYALSISDFLKKDLLTFSSIQGQYLKFSNQEFRALGKDATLSDLLDRAGKTLQTRTDLDPLARAEISHLIGVSYRRSARADKAIPFLKEAAEYFQRNLGMADRRTTDALNSLGVSYPPESKDGHPWLQKALESSMVSYGETDGTTTVIMSNLAVNLAKHFDAEKGIELAKKSLAICEGNHEGPQEDTINSRLQLAMIYRIANDLKKSSKAYRITIAESIELLTENHPRTINAMTGLAANLKMEKKYPEAIDWLIRCVNACEQVYGPKKLNTIGKKRMLAECYSVRSIEDFAKSIPLRREVVQVLEAEFGPRKQITMTEKNNLAFDLSRSGKYRESIPINEQLLQVKIAEFGPTVLTTVTTKNNLAMAYQQAGETAKAIELLRDVYDWNCKQHSPKSRSAVKNLVTMASIYWSDRQFDKSIPLFEKVLKIRRAENMPNDKATADAIANLGVNYLDGGRLDDAIRLLEEAIELEHGRWCMSRLREAYFLTKDHDKYLQLIERQIGLKRISSKRVPTSLASTLAVIGLELIQMGEFDKAELHLTEALEIRKKLIPGHWLVANTESTLGETFLRRARFDEAQPLLERGFEGMRVQDPKIPMNAKRRMFEAVNRLIELAKEMEDEEALIRWEYAKTQLKNEPWYQGK